ncbi:alpha/beta hydrolase family protein [Nocardia jiangxiensis]|uniref:Alpha/beta hydrolase family protein n=1 Tax=Nocardia jiangxiensis TaxID=282685 RepID=A0ABW6S067_9NOCA|nr:alpha/beta fold hydrolase [Nocardia jiangxiensis]
MHTSTAHVDIVFAPDTVADRRTAAALIDRALHARRLIGEVVFAADAAQFTAAAESAAQRGEFIAIPGDGAEFTAPPTGAIRLDLGRAPADRSVGIRAHIRERGLDGLRFAVDSWYHHRLHPATVVPYGDQHEQHAELRIPDGNGPFPAVALFHGGYWRSRWAADLMDALAIDLTARGYLSWNVEYRRPDEYGWAATTHDTAAAVRALGEIEAADPARIVLAGHSAGAQLALRAAADAVAEHAAVRPILAISLAGVLDLRLADARGLSENATAGALGGHRSEQPEIYRRSSPIDRLPLGLPHLVVSAVHDDPNLLEMSREYHSTAVTFDDPVTYIEGPGNHFAVIDPADELWSRTVAEIARAANHDR